MLDFIGVKDVAKILHVSNDTVRRIVREGDLVGYQIGSQLRFTAEDVEAYLQNSKTRKEMNNDSKTN